MAADTPAPSDHSRGALLRGCFLRCMRELAYDPKNFGACIDPAEFDRHRRRPPAIGRTIEHGADGFAQSLRRRPVGCQIYPDARPRDPCVHVGLVFSQPCGDKRDAKAHGLIDAAIAAIGNEYVDLGQYPFERQILGEARVGRNWARDGIDRAAACGNDHE